jgi:hypothetical protein
MARWTHVVIALLGMTGLALAQSPPPPYPAQPPPPYPAQPPPPYPAQPPPPYPAQPPPSYPAQPPPPYPAQPPLPAAAPATLEGSAPATKSKLGGDLAVVVPFGNYSKGITAALGMFGWFEHALSPQAFTTVRLGYLYHLIDSDPSFAADVQFLMIPIFVGARYNFAPTGDGLFLISEAGLNILWSSVSAPDLGIEDSNTELKASFNLGAGFQTGAVSAKGTLFVTAGAGTDTEGRKTSLVGLMVTVGIDFATL